MVRIDHETRAAVGEHDAGLLRADADPEGRVECIDEGDGHAVAIHDREINGVVAGRRGARQRNAPTGVDAAGKLGGKVLVEQVLRRNPHGGRVGDVRIAHPISKPRRLEREVIVAVRVFVPPPATVGRAPEP